MILKSTGSKFSAKIMRGNYIFCCSSRINFNPTRHLNTQIKQTKRKFFENISHKLSNKIFNPKKFWSLLNILLNCKKNTFRTSNLP